MKIKLEVEVFDDPVYCADKSNQQTSIHETVKICQFCSYNESWCYLFSESIFKAKKCPECLEALKGAEK
jgi:hypothetical protein